MEDIKESIIREREYKESLSKIDIKTHDGSSYPIIIDRGIIENINELINLSEFGSKATIITDDTVDSLYTDKIVKGLSNNFKSVNKIVVKPGEASKSISITEDIFNKLVEFNHRRSDVIIALGGGVIGDLAGFVSSVYLRGVPFIQVPTTLLSQVDSSVGGKVAINIAGGKNLVGSFYNPRAVIIDVDTLNTLTVDQLKDGLGEVIKYGYIHDASILEDLSKYNIDTILGAEIKDIVYKCIIAKQYFVERDFFDRDLRMILNFGHTLGHAIERQFGYGKVTHGQAVGAGMFMISKMLYMIEIIESKVYEDIKIMLEKFDMKCEYNLDYKNVIESIKIDKKSLEEKINVIASNGPGVSQILKIDIEKFIDTIEKYYKGSETNE